MTAPPLPASPCVRVRLDYTQSDGYLAGSRFYLSYAGSAPTGANCTTLAGDIAATWNTALAQAVNTDISLTEVDVLDIASAYGNSGVWNGSHAGTSSGSPLPSQVAQNVEFDILRRYRGGKPRMFLPYSNTGNLADQGHWQPAWLTDVNGYMATFFGDIGALSIGAMGGLAHVNLSYYEGFTNVTNSSGRTRAAPKYRTSALVDVVQGYSAKGKLGSQNRRRTATTY